MNADIYPLSYKTLNFNDGCSEAETQPSIRALVTRVNVAGRNSLQSPPQAIRVADQKISKSKNIFSSNNKITDVISFESTFLPQVNILTS